MTYPRIEKPTEPGLYWLKIDGETSPVRVINTSFGLAYRVIGSPIIYAVAEHSGDWRGPIPEPTE